MPRYNAMLSFSSTEKRLFLTIKKSSLDGEAAVEPGRAKRLKSAIQRQDAQYFGKKLFPTPWDKMGALTQSILQEHVFNNGNKRTAFACIGMFLVKNGYSLEMSNEDAEEMMVSFVTEERFKETMGLIKSDKSSNRSSKHTHKKHDHLKPNNVTRPRSTVCESAPIASRLPVRESGFFYPKRIYSIYFSFPFSHFLHHLIESTHEVLDWQCFDLCSTAVKTGQKT
ncbi:death-on-curing family protein [Melghirimyces profundicolus]|uniref:Death-on-curing family protein n=1 Tax=Melghirimyces profundicolus TaxID=1242148 RepID=A0A2T6AWE1_9BACL|nr:type II toxin-antitoxin system death-on-curing family toxin [Melghirimyces profundicolus]PTX48132.1 death-on-curing family protein [Melghirimyces profundicolus]